MAYKNRSSPGGGGGWKLAVNKAVTLFVLGTLGASAWVSMLQAPQLQPVTVPVSPSFPCVRAQHTAISPYIALENFKFNSSN